MNGSNALAMLRPRVADVRLDGCLHRAGVWLHETCCALHGHDLLLHFDDERVCLRCAACGHETRGWVVARAHQRHT